MAGTVLANPGMAARTKHRDRWIMPDEGEPHERTWMAFGASERIWGHDLVTRVRQDLAAIANTIAQFEPVSMLVRRDEISLARNLLDPSIELVESPLDDLWIRDTGPTFLVNENGERAAVDLNFNGWGNKQSHSRDKLVAARVAETANVPVINTQLVLEGGCIEVDGHGTAIITESCVLNDNRNPGVSRAAFEDLLMPLLGLEKIIWLPGIPGRDITDGHTDFYARFAGPGTVVAAYDPDPESFDHAMTEQHLEILGEARDAGGNALELLVLEGPMEIRPGYAGEDFAAGYVGYYLCNGAVIMQSFGDKRADRAARETLQSAFPDRTIEQLNVDGLAAGGGSIHCATQQEPRG